MNAQGEITFLKKHGWKMVRIANTGIRWTHECYPGVKFTQAGACLQQTTEDCIQESTKNYEKRIEDDAEKSGWGIDNESDMHPL